MLCVGLTGGIGVGKTSIARLFAGRGAFVLNADRIVHQLLLPKSSVWEQVVSQWSPSILIPGENRINREQLSEIVFKGADSLKRLLNILYPPLKEEIYKAKEKATKMGASIFLFEGSQILEAGWHPMFDVIVLVVARFEIRRERLLKDGSLDPDQIGLRMGFQWPDWVKIRYADFLIDNSGPIYKTRDLVDQIYARLLEF